MKFFDCLYRYLSKESRSFFRSLWTVSDGYLKIAGDSISLDDLENFGVSKTDSIWYFKSPLDKSGDIGLPLRKVRCLLSIGAVEALYVLDKHIPGFCSIYLESLRMNMKTKSPEELNQISNSVCKLDFSKLDETVYKNEGIGGRAHGYGDIMPFLFCGYKHSWTRGRDSSMFVKDVAFIEGLYHYDKELYWTVVLSICDGIFTVYNLFVDNPDTVSDFCNYRTCLTMQFKQTMGLITSMTCVSPYDGNSDSPINISLADRMKLLVGYRHKPYDFSIDGVRCVYTDVRQLSLALMTLLSRDIALRTGQDSVFDRCDIGTEETSNYLHGLFNSCIGSDFLSRYLNYGEVPSKVMYRLCAQKRSIEGTEVFWIQYVQARFCTEYFGVPADMWKKFLTCDVSLYFPESSTCLIEVLRSLALSSGDLVINSSSYYRERLSSLEHVNQRLKKKCENLRTGVASTSGVVKEPSPILGNSQDKYNELVKALCAKDVQCKEWRMRYETLKKSIDCAYREEDVLEQADKSDVSLEEMVEYLNQFHICIAGGWDNVLAKLAGLGLYNVSRVSTASPSTHAKAADYVCIVASHISHKVSFWVNKYVVQGRDVVIYFSGTNSEALVRSCYDFIKSRRGKE